MQLAPSLAVAGILFFTGASFLFAVAETALFSLSKWQVQQLAGKSGTLGRAVERLLGAPQDLLATIALGNTFACAAVLAITLGMALGGGWNLPMAAAGALAAIIFIGEILPKTLAVRASESWALRVARPMLFLQWFTRPLHRVAQKVDALILKAATTEFIKPSPTSGSDEYKELLELASQRGTLGQSEKEIILQIISLEGRVVREVMRPRAQMATIPDDLSVEQMLEAARKFKHRRLPMYDDTPDTIVSVLNTRALLLDPTADLLDVIEFPSFVPESMNLLELLKSLQRQQRGIAIVLDEFGSTAGIVTMDDILGDLVGGSHAARDTGGFVMEKLGVARWRVSGTMRLEDFRREYPQLGEVAELETMGGLLASLVGVVPVAGDWAKFRGLKLTAHAVDERRVRELMVEQSR